MKSKNKKELPPKTNPYKRELPPEKPIVAQKTGVNTPKPGTTPAKTPAKKTGTSE